MIQFLKNMILLFACEIIHITLRGPMIAIVLMPVIGETGAWHFIENSWAAFDVQRTVDWNSGNSRVPNMATIAIDDTGYQSFFDAKSPIDRNRVQALLSTITQHAKGVKRITIDLDLSPVPGQAEGQSNLDRFFLENPSLWVLAAVNSGAPSDIKALHEWRAQLCSKGISFGLPYVPNEFGYPKLTNQFVNGLADMSLQAAGTCADPAMPFVQKEMPLSPEVLQTGLMIPFSGDLQALGEILDAVDVDWIMVGGAWGQTDVFGTPFGKRFGVQVHLAALAGALSHEREAPAAISVIVAILFISLCSAMLKYMNTTFKGMFRPPPLMVGHKFYLQHIQPVLFVGLVLLLLAGLCEALALLRAGTGYWIPSSIVACTTLGTLLLTWNWGQNDVPAYESFRHVWKEEVSDPIKLDLKSVAQACSVVLKGPTPSAWKIEGTGPPIGRGRAALEGLFASLSLIMQTAVPLGGIVYATATSIP